jgi:cytochrome P450
VAASAVALTEVDLAEVDLCDLDRFADGFPDDVFSTLRRRAPCWWQEPGPHTPDATGFWVLSRHADIAAAAADAARFSSERAPGAEGGGTIIQDLPYGVAPGVLLNMMDDPRHHEVRRLLTPAFSPRRLVELAPDLRTRARRIVNRMAERGACDFLTDVAVELPLQAVAALLGVPDEDTALLLAWSNAILDYEGRELGETSPRAAEGAAALSAYATELVRERRSRPGDDLVSTMARAEVAGADGVPAPLDELELVMFVNLMVAAGTETTRNSIALGMVALVERPDQLADLAADRSLMGSATEEILRWTSATLYNRRTATADVEVGGRMVAAGEKVTLWWPSANRDEAVFDRPFDFDIRRAPNPHLSFGHRAHFCLGANLARLEIGVLFEELLDRLCDFELTGPVRRVRTNKHAGVWHVPMAFSERATPPGGSRRR